MMNVSSFSVASKVLVDVLEVIWKTAVPRGVSFITLASTSPPTNSLLWLHESQAYTSGHTLAHRSTGRLNQVEGNQD